MKRTFSQIVVLLLLALTLLAGCAGGQKDEPKAPKEGAAAPATQAPAPVVTKSPATVYPLTLTDDEGRTVTLNAEPKRVLSLAPSAGELVFALGKGGLLVGRTDFDDYPAEIKKVPSVGSLFPPNYEQIVAAKPDLVLMMGGSKAEKQKLIEEYKLNVLTLQPSNFDGIYHDIELLGQALNAQGEAVRITGGMKSAVTEVTAQAAGAKSKPSIFYLVSDEGYWTAGRGTFIDALITMAGGKNAADVDGFATYSLEKLVEANPDLLVLEQKDALERVKASDALKGLKAVQQGHVVVVPDVNTVVRPGPRLVSGLRWFYAQMQTMR